VRRLRQFKRPGCVLQRNSGRLVPTQMVALSVLLSRRQMRVRSHSVHFRRFLVRIVHRITCIDIHRNQTAIF